MHVHSRNRPIDRVAANDHFPSSLSIPQQLQTLPSSNTERPLRPAVSSDQHDLRTSPYFYCDARSIQT